MQVKKKRLTLDLDPPVQRRLKAVAALKSISMRQYCLTAIDKELAMDEANGVVKLPFGPEAIERFATLQEDSFDGEVLPGNGAEFIREARESRNIS